MSELERRLNDKQLEVGLQWGLRGGGEADDLQKNLNIWQIALPHGAAI